MALTERNYEDHETLRPDRRRAFLGGIALAVVLESAARANPAPCDHFSVVINVDSARSVVVQIYRSDLPGPITDEEIAAMLKLWARYHTSRGISLTQLVGKTIFQEIP